MTSGDKGNVASSLLNAKLQRGSLTDRTPAGEGVALDGTLQGHLPSRLCSKAVSPGGVLPACNRDTVAWSVLHVSTAAREPAC